jgi:hypothetical protein
MLKQTTAAYKPTPGRRFRFQIVLQRAFVLDITSISL